MFLTTEGMKQDSFNSYANLLYMFLNNRTLPDVVEPNDCHMTAALLKIHLLISSLVKGNPA